MGIPVENAFEALTSRDRALVEEIAASETSGS